MSLPRLVLVYTGALLALLTALFFVANNSPAVWTGILVGLLVLGVNFAWLTWLQRNPRPAVGVPASSGWMTFAGLSFSKHRLAVAIVGAAVLAIPQVTLLALMVMFPILFFAIIAIVANALPLLIAPALVLRELGFRFDPSPLVEKWVYCTILWIGSAIGFANMGSAGASIGAKDAPFFEVLFLPWIGLARYLGS